MCLFIIIFVLYYSHPWDSVACAAQRKYPNPLNPAVVGVDVIDRYVDKSGILRTHRLIHTTWSLADWAEKILGRGPQYASEHSACDSVNKKLVLRSRNLTFCDVISIDETLIYTRHPEDSSKTMLKQEAMVNVYGIPLGSYCESLLAKAMQGNANVGRKGLEWVINDMKQQQSSPVGV